MFQSFCISCRFTLFILFCPNLLEQTDTWISSLLTGEQESECFSKLSLHCATLVNLSLFMIEGYMLASFCFCFFLSSFKPFYLYSSKLQTSQNDNSKSHHCILFSGFFSFCVKIWKILYISLIGGLQIL